MHIYSCNFQVVDQMTKHVLPSCIEYLRTKVGFKECDCGFSTELVIVHLMTIQERQRGARQYKILDILSKMMYAQFSMNFCGQKSIPGTGFK